jgi:uncharacterized protein (TIGR02118 family)
LLHRTILVDVYVNVNLRTVQVSRGWLKIARNGEAAMIKAITFVKCKPGMSVEDFQAYWREKHPLAVERLPGLRRYVQSHALLSGYRKGELPWDGIAEVWMDDVEAFRRLPGTREYAAVLEDEKAFIGRSAMLLVDDVVVKDGPVRPDGVKSIEFVNRPQDMDVERFHAYWRDVHGPIAARIPVLRRYVQSHARMGAYKGGREPVYDGCAITWFDSTADMRLSATTPEYAATRADEANFLPPGHLPIVIAREHVIVA